jgi:hypothetical protein
MIALRPLAWRRAALVAATALVAACGGTQTPQDKLAHDRPAKGPPEFAFDDTFQDVMEFEQGIARTYDLAASAHVPEPGKAIVTAEDLPVGATLDDGKLTYAAPCGRDDAFYQRGYGVSYIMVTLRSSASDAEYVKRRVALLVHAYKVYKDRPCGTL